MRYLNDNQYGCRLTLSATDVHNLLNSFSLLNEFWGSRGCSQMVVFIGASSLSHSIDRYPNIKRRLGRRIKATPGLSFNPQADREKQVRHILRSVPRGEGIILWHDVLNNSITSHPQIKRTPLTPEQLVEVSSVPNLIGIVYIQREVSKNPLVLAPNAYRELKSTGIPTLDVIRNTLTKKKQESDLPNQYRKLHIKPFLEIHLLQTILNFGCDLQKLISRHTRPSKKSRNKAIKSA